MRKYLLPEEGRFYKANLHSHSTVSDGMNTPEQLKELYKGQGYSILAITDHELIVDHSELDDEDFLTLTSVEYAICEDKPKVAMRTVEFNMFARDRHNVTQVCFAPEMIKHGETWRVPIAKYAGELVKKRFDVDFMQHVIDEARANGFIVSLNHPSASLITPELFGSFEGLFAMEIYNQDAHLCGVCEYNPGMYDEMLRRGKRIACIAADDCHGSEPDDDPRCGRYAGFIMVKARELEYGEVIGALERGDFYASTGPFIEELYVEDGVIRIKCSPTKEIAMMTQYRPFGGIRVTREGEYLTEAEFKIPRNGGYFRFDLIDDRGHHANTRAYFEDEYN